MKKSKEQSSSILTMFRKCEKLSPRFPWKAVLPRNNRKLCFPKINCPKERTIQRLVNCPSYSSRNLFDEDQTKSLKNIFELKNSKKCTLTNKETNKYKGKVAL